MKISVLGSRRSLTTGMVLAAAAVGCLTLQASPAHAVPGDAGKCVTGAVVFGAGIAGTAATDGVAGAFGGLGAMLGGEETMHTSCPPAPGVVAEIPTNPLLVKPHNDGTA